MEEVESYIFVIALALLSVLGFYLLRIFRDIDAVGQDLHPMDFVPTQAMAQVYNPFHFTLDGIKSSVTHGIKFSLSAQDSCVVLACWGVTIKDIYSVVYQPWQSFNSMFKDLSSAREKLQEISSHVDQERHIDSIEVQSFNLKPPERFELGKIPRAKYPLVLFLLSPVLWQEEDLRNVQNRIVCHVIIFHLSDPVCPATSHVIAQFVRTPYGYPCNIRPLYTNDEQQYEATPAPSHNQTSHQPTTESTHCTNHPSHPTTESTHSTNHPSHPAPYNEQSRTESKNNETLNISHEEHSQTANLHISCLICQLYLVDRVVLPCRHACVCEVCFPQMDRCPMCRGKIESTFRLGGDMRSPLYGPVNNGDMQDDNVDKPWYIRWNDKLNHFLGFT